VHHFRGLARSHRRSPQIWPLPGSTEKPRAAVVSHLETTESHAKGFEALATESTGASADTLGVSMSKDVVTALHQTHLKWAASLDHSAGGTSPPF